ncbi:MAG: preprotein translocase subunit SecG [Alphaproteobacteria bacterium]|nr:preprotein translocase subunit SecG [Alphaproteobacteria bacterium]MDE2340687.1 preprotein translocase subunit SecG [Alphaproteobacteria bacterium]
MITFLVAVQIVVALALVGVILMQRSEGGGFGSGGSPAGLMSARGAADFLTRTTAILAGIFIILSIVLAGLVAHTRASTTLDTTLKSAPAPAQTQAPAPTNPNDPLSALAPGGGTPQAAPALMPPTAPQTAPSQPQAEARQKVTQDNTHNAADTRGLARGVPSQKTAHSPATAPKESANKTSPADNGTTAAVPPAFKPSTIAPPSLDAPANGSSAQ